MLDQILWGFLAFGAVVAVVALLALWLSLHALHTAQAVREDLDGDLALSRIEEAR